MECNLVDENGTIDLPVNRLRYLDVVLLGIHPNTPKGLGREAYTRMLLKAVEKNPAVDIITHLNDETYPVDFEAVVLAAEKRGIAIELNNSKTLLKRSPDALTRDLVEIAKSLGSRMVVTSDMHALEELGRDRDVEHFLHDAAFPDDKLVSLNAASAFEFLDERRKNKK
jgi:putative hydrolase